jgi:hypothetical protein
MDSESRAGRSPLPCPSPRLPARSARRAPRAGRARPPPPPPPRTKWTRRVLHPVLIGHAASLTRQAARAKAREVERRCLALERELHEAQRRAEVRFPLEPLPPLPPPIGAVAPNGSSPKWLKRNERRSAEQRCTRLPSAATRCSPRPAGSGERGWGRCSVFVCGDTVSVFCISGHRQYFLYFVTPLVVFRDTVSVFCISGHR